MRSLALARYRILTAARSGKWIFIVSLLMAAAPKLLQQAFFLPGDFDGSDDAMLMRSDAQIAVFTYALHLVVIAAAADLSAVRRRVIDGAFAADLTETMPITPMARFFGDALGVLASTLIIHVSTLPLLALGIALSPLPSGALVFFELATLAAAILASAATSWQMRSAGRASLTRGARAIVLFGILFLVTIGLTTPWRDFRDATAGLLAEPSPISWRSLGAAIPDPAVFLVALALLYGSFVAFFALDSVRQIKRQ